ncbi:type II toxin-antitoxin system HicB family antitoxin [Lactobacillus sp. ESL0791]|uniref:type II toxin-antitoxin system HicB family antitoxin n=1 Tax=Lactobacillus sp. ESL0791 TaxID=2983234 RepID=UPI0023F8C19A|nr:type II toxin-antitoxin system HicB family antitoxin [Lactobacillus sp. ESL0791]MDF7639953.1 type II toxin-antitoxin system HicB family antitoxin [Lactobacillus sp. ESL0791]
MKNKDLLVYPIILHPENEGGFSVEIPDVEGGTWTQGEDMADAIYMASDAIGALLVDKSVYPKPSKLEDIKTDATAIKTVTTVDMSKYRKLNEKTVRKNVSVPEYLVELGKKQHINFSQVLTEALEEKLLKA